jgi:hypothetical protein
MDAPKKFELNERHVEAFIRAAPRDVLLRLKNVMDSKLELSGDEEKKRGVMAAMLENSKRTQGSDVFNSAPMPDSPIEIPPIEVDNVRARLINMAATQQKSTSSIDDMHKQLDMMANISDDVLDDTVDVMYIMTDQYNDGLVSIQDLVFQDKIEKKRAECAGLGMYFPYGFGQQKNLLKIKNFRRPVRNEILRLNLTFRRWSSNGKQGFSCYTKDK